MTTAAVVRTTQGSLVRKVFAIALSIVLLGVFAFIAAAWAPDRTVDSLRARWAPPPSEFQRIDGLDVHLRDVGPRSDPQPIVLLHGTSSSLHTWEAWGHDLVSERRVISFDLPGFGLTGPDPHADYSMERYVRFVVAVLDARGVRQCVLAGNSLGGAIAWETALRAPDRVARLILIDAVGYNVTPTSMPLGFRLARSPVLAPIARNLLTHQIIAHSLRDVYGDPSRVTDSLIERYYQLTLRAGNRAAVTERFRQSHPGQDEAMIPRVHVPTLILWGARDRLIPPESARRFQHDIAGSESIVYPSLGHVPQEEAPELLLPDVRRFLGLPVHMAQ